MCAHKYLPALLLLTVACGAPVDEQSAVPLPPAAVVTGGAGVAAGGSDASQVTVAGQPASGGSVATSAGASAAGAGGSSGGSGGLAGAGAGGGLATAGQNSGGAAGATPGGSAGALAMGGGGSAAGAAGTPAGGSATQLGDPCDLPADGPGSVCGNACGYTQATRPAGYGYPTANGGQCDCKARSVGSSPVWVDLVGPDQAFCSALVSGDPSPVRTYNVNGLECVQVSSPWKGQWMRASVPDPVNATHTYKTSGKLGTCVRVAGVDVAGNAPPVIVEVFGKPDQSITVTSVPCAGMAAGAVVACDQ